MLSGLQAQTISTITVPEQIDFVPTKITLTQDFDLNHYYSFQTQPNKFLKTTGWILNGIKFDSPIDEFTAIKPFDIRAYTPPTISEYSSLITKNYLLINNRNLYGW